jgi:hypothetical protein
MPLMVATLSILPMILGLPSLLPLSSHVVYLTETTMREPRVPDV